MLMKARAMRTVARTVLEDMEAGGLRVGSGLGVVDRRVPRHDAGVGRGCGDHEADRGGVQQHAARQHVSWHQDIAYSRRWISNVHPADVMKTDKDWSGLELHFYVGVAMLSILDLMALGYWYRPCPRVLCTA